MFPLKIAILRGEIFDALNIRSKGDINWFWRVFCFESSKTFLATHGHWIFKLAVERNGVMYRETAIFFNRN